MGTSSFQAGAHIEIEQKAYHLVLLVDDQTWQLEELRTKRVHEEPITKLQDLYASGQLTFLTKSTVLVSEKMQLGKPAIGVSEAEFKNAKIRRVYAMAVMAIPNTCKEFEPVIASIWSHLKQPDNPPHWTTVYRWKTKLQQAGKDIRALAASCGKRGNRTPRYPKEVLDLSNYWIEKRYLTLERRTIQDTLDAAMVAVIQENKLRPDAIQLPLPTRRLITSLIEVIPAFDRYAARHGRMAATKRFRSVQAHRTTQAPLERAEMDHTPLDLMVIDDLTLLPLGRPYITVCMDDYTRCLLGIYISFEPPSFLTVARCLKHVFLPKTRLQEQFPNIKNAWEAHGVMRELVVDNGAEFHSESLENACYSLGIEMHYSARKTPWFKGKIERFQGTLNGAIAHGNPGTTFRNIFEKEEYDSSKHAVIRLSVLKEIANKWVVDVYHQKPHRTLQAPPSVVWKKSIRTEDILLPDDPAELDAILGRSEERCLTHKGIELNGLQYNSPELTDLRRQLGDTLVVHLRIDDADLGQIIVLSPDKKRMFKVPSITPNYANGLSAWQHRVCKKFAAREMEKYDPTSWLEAKLAISKLIDEEFMNKKQGSRTKIARFMTGQTLPQSTSELTDNSCEQKSTFTTQNTDLPQEPRKSTPLTPADIMSPEQEVQPRPAKRFKALQRERLPQAVEAEQADMPGDNHV